MRKEKSGGLFSSGIYVSLLQEHFTCNAGSNGALTRTLKHIHFYVLMQVQPDPYVFQISLDLLFCVKLP